VALLQKQVAEVNVYPVLGSINKSNDLRRPTLADPDTRPGGRHQYRHSARGTI